MTKRTVLLSLAAAVMMTSPALAHTGIGHVNSFAQGALHPFAGVDHVLAMLAVGLFAAGLGGAALWLVPAAFVSTMIFGGVLGYYGWSLPMVEMGIGLSVIVMGAAIAAGVRLPTIAAMGLVGLFAIFHGHAHGSEGAGSGLSFLPYAAGFIAATASLHAMGIALGIGLDRLGDARAALMKRSAGSLGALAGIALISGWLAA